MAPPLRPPEPPLDDGVVRLRPWRRADAAALAVVVDDPAVERWTSTPQPYRERDALDWFASHPVRWASGEGAPLAIVAAGDGRLLGSIELRRDDADHGVGEVAYAVGAADRGHGVARRAVGLVCEWAFGELGLRRIELLTHLDNVASQRVAAACGFVREGVRPSARVVRGRSVDLVVFALDR